jgi:hypothetical protein
LTIWRRKLALSWRKLNEILAGLTEEQVLRLLEDERITHRRLTVLERLHQRYTALRTSRERIELLKEAKRP